MAVVAVSDSALTPCCLYVLQWLIDLEASGFLSAYATVDFSSSMIESGGTLVLLHDQDNQGKCLTISLLYS